MDSKAIEFSEAVLSDSESWHIRPDATGMVIDGRVRFNDDVEIIVYEPASKLGSDLGWKKTAGLEDRRLVDEEAVHLRSAIFTGTQEMDDDVSVMDDDIGPDDALPEG